MSEPAPGGGILPIAAVLLLVLPAAGTTYAQQSRLGLGAQVGKPAGLTARILLESGTSTGYSRDAMTLQATFDLDDYYLFQAHVTRDIGIRRSPIGLFTGPGVYVGRRNGEQELGVGAMGGARFFKGRFEVHFQLSPRLRLSPDVRTVMGAGVGLRYYP